MKYNATWLMVPQKGYQVDNLSVVHFKAVSSEIEGRFFSKEEAEQLKKSIDKHTITDHDIRIAAAMSWDTNPLV